MNILSIIYYNNEPLDTNRQVFNKAVNQQYKFIYISFIFQVLLDYVYILIDDKEEIKFHA
jgi:hypothetical protein